MTRVCEASGSAWNLECVSCVPALLLEINLIYGHTPINRSLPLRVNMSRKSFDSLFTGK